MPSTPTGVCKTKNVSPKPKIQKKAARPRPAARPHKRLADDKLDARILDLNKKLQVLGAKTTLLQDRLEVYEKEKQTRDQAAAAAST